MCPGAADAEAVGPAHEPRPWHRPSVGIACVLLVYSVVLISAIQQGDSVTHTQLCPTLCDPMDCSPPGSSVHRILQARILEGVAISFSRGSSRPKDLAQVSWHWQVRWILCHLTHQGSPVTHIYTFFFLILFSIMVYPRRLDIVSCAI